MQVEVKCVLDTEVLLTGRSRCGVICVDLVRDGRISGQWHGPAMLRHRDIIHVVLVRDDLNIVVLNDDRARSTAMSTLVAVTCELCLQHLLHVRLAAVLVLVPRLRATRQVIALADDVRV